MKRYIVLFAIVAVFSFHLQNIEAAPVIFAGHEEIQSLTGIESNEQARTNFETLLPLIDENLSGEILKIEQIIDANKLDENANDENDSKETPNQTPTLQEAIQIIQNEVILNRTKNRYVDIETNPETSNLERVEQESELELELDLDDSNDNFNTEETPKPENVIHFDSNHLKYLPIFTKSPNYAQNSTKNITQEQLVVDYENPSGNVSIESLIKEDLEFDNDNENESTLPNSDSKKSVEVLLVSEIEVNSIANETTGPLRNLMDDELDWDSNQEIEAEAEDFNSILTKNGKKITSLIPKYTDKSNTSQHSTTGNTTLTRPLVVGQNTTDGDFVGNFKTSSEFSVEFEPLSDLDDEYMDHGNGKTVEINLPEINLSDNNDLDKTFIPDLLQGVQEVEQEIDIYSSHPFYFLVGPFTLPNNTRVPSSFFQIQADSKIFSSAPFIIHLDDAKGRQAEAQTPEDVIQALAEKQAFSIFPRLK